MICIVVDVLGWCAYDVVVVFFYVEVGLNVVLIGDFVIWMLKKDMCVVVVGDFFYGCWSFVVFVD